MANDENLIPFSERSESEVREFNAKGGRKSGETRRKKRDMRKKMQMILSLPPSNCDDFNSVSEMGIDMSEIDNEMVMLAGLFNEAKSGNVKAVREVRNILGEDDSAAETELRQKEFNMKKHGNDTKQNSEIPKLMEALREDNNDIS